MIITRRKKIPGHWMFYVQLPLVLSIYGNFVLNTPFLFLMKRYIDNPAAIMGLISIEFWVTWLGGPFISWLSDRIWTRFGRRKFFFAIADGSKAFLYLLMPLAPNLWTLIIIRWLIGAVGDFGAMTQALIYETVPPPQRGKASGIFSSCMQFGNLIFFFLLVGRFDDVYFMGPFRFLTEINGVTLLFYLASFMLMGIAAFEALGFKEIRPPHQRLLKDEREPGTNIFIYFAKNIFKDIFAKDLLPLYLFMFINVMFGINLGIFQPLLFTEQWGYSLQDMGNTVAVGVITTVTFSLMAGWFADKYGKLKTFVIATALSFCVNIFYTVYVYFQPDFRPSLLEIIIIGNVGAAIGMVKGVVTFPLMMEYVRRDRMGSANAGMGLIGSAIRNLVTLGVGLWLLGWSIWFFPQAGYFVETTFNEVKSKAQVEEMLAEENLSPENLVLRPVHQYGVDGVTSQRWWIHKSDELTQEMLKERKDLNNELAPLGVKLDNPMLDGSKREKISGKVKEIETRLAEIKTELAKRLDETKSEVLPALENQLFVSGNQILKASFEQNQMILSLQTIEKLNEDQREEFQNILDGPQYEVIPVEKKVAKRGSLFSFLRSDQKQAPDAFETVWQGNLQVDLSDREDPSVQLTAVLDPNFTSLFQVFAENDVPAEDAFSLSSSLVSINRLEFGTEAEDYTLSNLRFEQGDETFTLFWEVTSAEPKDFERLSEVLSEEKRIDDVQVNITSETQASFNLSIHNFSEPEASLRSKRAEDIHPAMLEHAGQSNWKAELLTESYIRVTDAMASEPFYVTVPEQTPRADYQDREYEYFFAIQSLQISTDIIGFGIIWFLLVMEKKGVVHRAGAEEDENR